MGDKVDELLRLLDADPASGRTPVLLPIEGGTKGPKVAGWNSKSWEDMGRPDWVAQVEEHENTGVLLGPPSGHLVTLDFDSEEYFPEFLRVNPKLAGSLRTRGNRGCQVWMYMLADPFLDRFAMPMYPQRHIKVRHRTQFLQVPDPQRPGEMRSEPLEIVEWRGGAVQSVVAGRHPSGKHYQTIVEAPPVRIRFREIVWPEFCGAEWVAPFVDALIAQCGPQFTQAGESDLQMVSHFWAAWMAFLNDLVFDAEADRFFKYNRYNGRWEEQTGPQVEALISRMMLAMGAALIENPTHKRVLLSENCRGPRKLQGIARLLQGETTTKGIFERPPGMVHLANGMIDARRPESGLMPFAPDYYSRNQLPWKYDPEATCPRFLAQLLGPALDAEDIALVQRIFGSIILGHNLMQRIVVFSGTAGGGKSTLVSVMLGLVGRHNVAMLRTRLLNERFELAGFSGKTVLYGPDVPGHFLNISGAEMLKSLTGGDFVEGEHKHGGRVQLRGTWNCIMTTNESLTVRLSSDADAWRRRLLIVKWNQPPPTEKIPGLAEKLLEGWPERGWPSEASGILNWALEGARALLEEADLHGTMQLTGKHQHYIAEMLAESGSVEHFVQQALFVPLLDDPEDTTITMEELNEAYMNFCAARGWRPKAKNDISYDLDRYILQYHHQRQARDIYRTSPDGERKTQKRGYRRLRLLEAQT
jgi:phage/plasmid-associated DNA primase